MGTKVVAMLLFVNSPFAGVMLLVMPYSVSRCSAIQRSGLMLSMRLVVREVLPGQTGLPGSDVLQEVGEAGRTAGTAQ